MSLALSTLLFEWRRYLAAIVALAFSGLLVLSQLGMFMGVGKSFSATIDRSRADIMILAPKAEGLDGASGVPRRVMPEIYMHPDVVEVADFDSGGGRYMNSPPPGEKPKMDWVRIVAIDPLPGAVTLPTDYPEAIRQALLEPYAAVVDVTALKKLGVSVGDKASVNGKTIKIVGTLTGYPNLMQTHVMVSRDTLRLLGQASTGARVGPLMVKLRDPARAELVAAQINANSEGRYRAWTRPELAQANQDEMFKEAFIGIMLGFSLFLGLLIGVSITWQTLRGAIFANIREFASLRALGVSMGSLRAIVMELAFWVGIGGLFATAALTAGVSKLAEGFGLIMYYPAWSIGAVAVLLLGIALVSGMLSLGVLKKSQPADLLR
jgi:putative ABC transport system permease protein